MSSPSSPHFFLTGDDDRWQAFKDAADEVVDVAELEDDDEE